MPFSEAALAKIYAEYHTTNRRYEALLMEYLALELREPRALEFARQGFCRRLRLMVRCINNVFSILPPERQSVPSNEEVLNTTINIQAFTINVFGCLDNLAWIWVAEKNITAEDGRPMPNRYIGLSARYRSIRNSPSSEFREYLDSMSEWFDGIGDFCDALAHRIPPYIPPYVVEKKNEKRHSALQAEMDNALRNQNPEEWLRLSAEQEALGVFSPWLQHSFGEAAPPIYFHPQLLADFATVEALGRRMLKELRK